MIFLVSIPDPAGCPALYRFRKRLSRGMTGRVVAPPSSGHDCQHLGGAYIDFYVCGTSTGLALVGDFITARIVLFRRWIACIECPPLPVARRRLGSHTYTKMCAPPMNGLSVDERTMCASLDASVRGKNIRAACSWRWTESRTGMRNQTDFCPPGSLAP